MSGAIKNGDGRAPCCGWSGLQHLGGLFQHSRDSEQSVSVYPNVTKVPNWQYNSPGAPGPDIDPYPRGNSQLGIETAGTACEQDATCGAPGTNKPGCDGQTVTNVWGAVIKVRFALCMKYGHKRVQAGKRWHGRLGFTDMCGDSTNPPASGTPGNTKFRTVSWSWSKKVPDNDSRTGNYTESWGKGTISVDADTGVITAWDITVDARYANFDSSGNLISYTQLDPATASTVEISEMWNGCVPGVYTDALAGVTAGTPGFVASRTISNDTHIIHTEQGVSEFGTFDGSILLSDPYTSADVMTEVYALKALWNLADDITYPWRADGFTVRAPYVDRNEGAGQLQLIFTPTVDDYRVPTAGSGTVADPYTAWQPMAWVDFNSWAWVFPAGLDQRYAAATALVAKYDGKIRGAPLTFPIATGPLAGVIYPQKFWDGLHANDRLCGADDGADPPFFYTFSFGRWNVDDLMPATATQWTVLSDESNDLNPNAPISQGHWISMLPGDNLVRCQFEAIIEQPTPSQNYFGPSGPYRFGFDTGTVRCITDISADIVELFSDATINTGDICRVAHSTDATNGIYPVSKIDSTHYQLGTLLYDLTGYIDPLDAGGNVAAGMVDVTAQFGKVRWPNAWPIQGRALITAPATQSGANVLLTVEAVPYLRTGDKIDVQGITGLNDNLTVTVIDQTHISVPGTFAGQYFDQPYITSHGAPAWTWFDNRVKGDYVLLRWQWDYRDYLVDPSLRPHQASWGFSTSIKVFTAEDHCLCWKPCCPMVIMACEPGAPLPTNGVNHAFPNPGDVALDATLGYLWQGIIQTGMGELLWQPDPKPCVDSADIDGPPTCIAWAQDITGACVGNNPGLGCELGAGTFYYPMQPIVEARNTLPGGAPALPPGIFIGWIDQATMNAGPPGPAAHGAVALPPSPGGGQDGFWVTWQNLVGCATGGGQFSATYAQEVIF